MRVEFGFMSASQSVFTADIPLSLAGYRSQGTIITVNGVSRTLSYLDSPPDASVLFQGLTLARQLKSGRNSDVSVYQCATASTLTVFWRTANGYAWTWSDPAIDNEATLVRLATGVDIERDRRHGARLGLAPGIGLGDIRRPSERDTATFYSSDALDSVNFIHAGAFARDDELVQDQMVVVQVGTTSGVVVSCGGRADNRDALRVLAESVASTVAVA